MNASASKASSWRDRLSQAFSSMAGAFKSSSTLPVRTDLGSASKGMASVMGVDKALLWAIAALLLWGLIMVYSASVALPDNPRFAKYSHTHFLLRHTFLW
ncbi:MAG: hypothetical protein HC765_00920 [Brachymonas sp.]|nr:hypothetical protein [Brachymonas sp.]